MCLQCPLCINLVCGTWWRVTVCACQLLHPFSYRRFVCLKLQLWLPLLPPTCACCHFPSLLLLRFWWTTPINSRNRRKIAFATDDILEGPLLAKAVAIIQKSTWGC